jgi:hypothetical protein
MTTISLRSVRYAFTMFLLALTLFAVAESAVGGRADRAATVAEAAAAAAAPVSCGTAEEPCLLEAVTVVAAAATADQPVQVAATDASAGCGTEAAPCRLPVLEVRAEASAGHLASAERAVGMTLRVRS